VWYLLPVTTVLIGGTIPFGAIFIELFFILSSIWLHSFYYIFGILFLVFIILVLTCGEIAVVMCYFALSAEDYHWVSLSLSSTSSSSSFSPHTHSFVAIAPQWWRSFLTPASSAFYVFLYSVFYYYTRLEIDEFVPTLLYFSYTFIFTVIFFLMTGTVGFYSCLFFVTKIYSSIKVD
jgi:transmembrane 9 superfamily protein 2/4